MKNTTRNSISLFGMAGIIYESLPQGKKSLILGQVLTNAYNTNIFIDAIKASCSPKEFKSIQNKVKKATLEYKNEEINSMKIDKKIKNNITDDKNDINEHNSTTLKANITKTTVEKGNDNEMWN